MKLIIDISEEDYKRCTVMASAIRNGIPLDDVKAEIRNLSFDVTERSSGEQIELNYTANVLKILDNIGKESAERKKGEPWETN